MLKFTSKNAIITKGEIKHIASKKQENTKLKVSALFAVTGFIIFRKESIVISKYPSIKNLIIKP